MCVHTRVYLHVGVHVYVFVHVFLCMHVCMCTCVYVCATHILKHSLKYSRTGTHTNTCTGTHTHHTCYTQALVHTYTNVHTPNTYTLNYVLKHSYSSKYFLKGLGPRIKPGLGSKKNHHHYSFASPSYPDVRCKMRPWLRLGMDKTLVMLYPPRFRWDFGCL